MKIAALIVGAGICLFSGIFYAATTVLLRRWMGEKKPGTSTSEPVTFFRPLKPGEIRLREHLQVFLAGIEPGDQVLCGVRSERDREIVADLAREFPEADLTCVVCAETGCRNPKVSKLIQLEPLARHDLWIILDSDTTVGADELRAFRAEWSVSGADAASAPYFFQNAETAFARLDAVATSLTLWPGVSLLRARGGIDFLLGACMGIRASVLKSLGGWKAFGDALADDNELARAVVRQGGRVHATNTPVGLDAGTMSAAGWILHQHRALSTYRLCNPLGSLGLPLTHGIAASLVIALAFGRSPLAWFVHGLLVFLRTLSAREFPGGDRRWHLGSVWLASVLEPIFWLSAWLPLPVRWSGGWLKTRRGKFAPCPPAKTD